MDRRLGRVLLEVAADSQDGPSRAVGAYEMVQRPFTGILKGLDNFRARSLAMDPGIGLIFELIGKEPPMLVCQLCIGEERRST
jgi:hypothetical protein